MADLLLVDDEKEMADELRVLLEDEGHRVDVAGGYAEAARQFASRRYDLVILDLIMPIRGDEGIDPATVAHGRETGVAVFEHVRRAAPGQPIIITTVVRGESILGKVRSANRILKKPFYPDELLEAVAQTLAGTGSGEADGQCS